MPTTYAGEVSSSALEWMYDYAIANDLPTLSRAIESVPGYRDIELSPYIQRRIALYQFKQNLKKALNDTQDFNTVALVIEPVLTLEKHVSKDFLLWKQKFYFSVAEDYNWENVEHELRNLFDVLFQDNLQKQYMKEAIRKNEDVPATRIEDVLEEGLSLCDQIDVQIPTLEIIAEDVLNHKYYPSFLYADAGTPSKTTRQQRSRRSSTASPSLLDENEDEEREEYTMNKSRRTSNESQANKKTSPSSSTTRTATSKEAEKERLRRIVRLPPSISNTAKTVPYPILEQQHEEHDDTGLPFSSITHQTHPKIRDFVLSTSKSPTHDVQHQQRRLSSSSSTRASSSKDDQHAPSQLREASQRLLNNGRDPLEDEQEEEEQQQQKRKGKRIKKKRKKRKTVKEPLELIPSNENEEEREADENQQSIALPDVETRDFDSSLLGKRPRSEAVRKDELDKLLEPSGRPKRKKRRERRWFTDEEVTNLIAGVRKYGPGQWSVILRKYNFNDRTSVDLKDKWRNLMKNEQRAIARKLANQYNVQ